MPVRPEGCFAQIVPVPFFRRGAPPAAAPKGAGRREITLPPLAPGVNAWATQTNSSFPRAVIPAQAGIHALVIGHWSLVICPVIPANAGTQAENVPPPKPRPIRTRTHPWIPASPCPERAQSSRAARPPDVGRLVGRSNPPPAPHLPGRARAGCPGSANGRRWPCATAWDKQCRFGNHRVGNTACSKQCRFGSRRVGNTACSKQCHTTDPSPPRTGGAPGVGYVAFRAIRRFGTARSPVNSVDL